MDAVQTIVTAHPFGTELAVDEVGQLAACATITTFPAGYRIFDEGEEARRFWLIDTGHVRVDTSIPGRGAVILETLGPGAVLGWSWLFPPRRWHFGAQAVTETTAVELDAEAVQALCERSPSLGYKLRGQFLQVVIDRLQNTRIQLLDLYGSSA